MAFELLVFKVVPNLFVWIPVRRVRRKIEHVESFLAGNETLGFLRCVRRSLVHDDYNVSTAVVGQYLVQEADNLIGRNAFVE